MPHTRAPRHPPSASSSPAPPSGRSTPTPPPSPQRRTRTGKERQPSNRHSPPSLRGGRRRPGPHGGGRTVPGRRRHEGAPAGLDTASPVQPRTGAGPADGGERRAGLARLQDPCDPPRVGGAFVAGTGGVQRIDRRVPGTAAQHAAHEPARHTPGGGLEVAGALGVGAVARVPGDEGAEAVAGELLALRFGQGRPCEARIAREEPSERRLAPAVGAMGPARWLGAPSRGPGSMRSPHRCARAPTSPRPRRCPRSPASRRRAASATRRWPRRIPGRPGRRRRTRHPRGPTPRSPASPGTARPPRRDGAGGDRPRHRPRAGRGTAGRQRPQVNTPGRTRALGAGNHSAGKGSSSEPPKRYLPQGRGRPRTDGQ